MEKPVQITRLPKSEYYASVFEIHKRQSRVPQQIPLSRLSKRLAERVITRGGEAVPDCISCGACCLYGLIPIERRDPEPISEYVEVMADHSDVIIERALFRNETDGRCRHLAGEIARNVGCNIYPDRPRTCRDFEAGSDRCFGYRRMFGIDPPLDDDELALALGKLEGRVQPVKIAAIDIKLASRTFTFDQNSPDPETPVAEELVLKVVAHLSDGEEKDIHTYDPAEESWYEHELEGLTLEKAREKIEQARAGN